MTVYKFSNSDVDPLSDKELEDALQLKSFTIDDVNEEWTVGYGECIACSHFYQ